MPEKTITAVFDNCATIASFRVSGEDAKALVREFGVSGEGTRTAEQMMDLIVPASELQNLPDYKMIYLRTLIDGSPKDPVMVSTFPPFAKDGHSDHNQSVRRERVIRASLERFGRKRSEVEAKLNGFLTFRVAA